MSEASKHNGSCATALRELASHPNTANGLRVLDHAEREPGFAGALSAAVQKLCKEHNDLKSRILELGIGAVNERQERKRLALQVRSRDVSEEQFVWSAALLDLLDRERQSKDIYRAAPKLSLDVIAVLLERAASANDEWAARRLHRDLCRPRGKRRIAAERLFNELPWLKTMVLSAVANLRPNPWERLQDILGGERSLTVLSTLAGCAVIVVLVATFVTSHRSVSRHEDSGTGDAPAGDARIVEFATLVAEPLRLLASRETSETPRPSVITVPTSGLESDLLELLSRHLGGWPIFDSVSLCRELGIELETAPRDDSWLVPQRDHLVRRGLLPKAGVIYVAHLRIDGRGRPLMRVSELGTGRVRAHVLGTEAQGKSLLGGQTWKEPSSDAFLARAAEAREIEKLEQTYLYLLLAESTARTNQERAHIDALWQRCKGRPRHLRQHHNSHRKEERP